MPMIVCIMRCAFTGIRTLTLTTPYRYSSGQRRKAEALVTEY